MSDKLWCVYKHTCPNGMAYIGITSQQPEIRWGAGMGYYKNKKFFRCILKTGWDNIQHEIICDGLSERKAQKVECEMIQSLGQASFNTIHKEKPLPRIYNEYDYTVCEAKAISYWAIALFGNIENDTLLDVADNHMDKWEYTSGEFSSDDMLRFFREMYRINQFQARREGRNIPDLTDDELMDAVQLMSKAYT